ncbi:MAG: hypothetical protein PWP23_2689 [Candidatus Sumerlaeota bacterium]|nr:hypothetical protein [Candidatus Sumerlaeota bacterium]
MSERSALALRLAVSLATAFFVLALSPPAAPAALTAVSRNESATPAQEEGWAPWPFLHWKDGEPGSLRALHPVFSKQRDSENGYVTSDIFWPLWTWTYRPETPTWRERKATTFFPFWYAVSGEKNGIEKRYRYLVPFYWQGETRDPDSGQIDSDYFILFPFLWKANNAKLTFPIFPRRPQNFFAIWPLWGEFHGFWNRDLIEFVLWPLFVRSSRGEGEDRLVQTSVPWPFVSWIRGGAGTWGFRLWPLVAYAEVPGKTKRAYWLWPLGQYRVEGEGAERREVNFFIPFWGRIRTPDLRYDMVFPFYGRLDMKGRRVRGYALAAYNEDDDLRAGLRRHRLLWFLFRWTSTIEVPKELTPSRSDPMRGGGFFPFYVHNSNSTREQLIAPWPIHAYRRTKSDDRTYDRRYVMPFYLRQTTLWKGGGRDQQLAIFPFYRALEGRDGSSYESAPHLFPYTNARSIDRNWAPFWTAWSREREAQARLTRTRVLGGTWQGDENWLGVRRRKLDTGIVKWESWEGTVRPQEKHASLLWGALKYDRMGPERQWTLFGRAL